MPDTATVKVGTTHPLGMRLIVHDWVNHPEHGRMLEPIGQIDLPGHDEGGPTTISTDAALFDKWMALNGESDVVKDSIVFRQGAAGK